MKKEEWKKKLLNKEAQCYFKPNRRKHESGFRCFEIGYLIPGKNNKVEQKLILGETTDHIQPFDYLDFTEKKPFPINIDVLLDGHIRIFSSGRVLWWGSMDWVVSSATISELTN